jgi:hypothetical protein
MNRCLSVLAALLLALGLSAAAPPASAQGTGSSANLPQRIPPISPKALRGTLRITSTPPDVLLDGQPARLAPGARIRNRNNLITISGALIGEDLPVRYTRDSLGLVFDVWVLTAGEVAVDPLPKR